ncbi:MAG: isoprenylcysteine carboxylmethyltransferase family protein [Verrucomicrobiia bacterium]
MTTKEVFQKQGHYCFRWRSYLPLILLPLLLFSLPNAEVIKTHFGKASGEFWKWGCVFISCLGFLIRCLVIGYAPGGTSGRNAKQQRADRLNQTGIYSLVRNPLYLGNFLMILGVALFTETFWFIIITIVVFTLFYERIILVEEEFLQHKFGEVFINWAQKTPAFIPKFHGWIQPDLSFSFKNVLKREYSGLLMTTLLFIGIDFLSDHFFEHRNQERFLWLITLIVSFTIYLILRTLKKKTLLLHKTGR